jgi:hypothetical protein
MDKATKEKLQEVQEAITRFTQYREETLRYLEKYPNDKYQQEYLAKYDAVLARATRWAKAVGA